MERPVRRGPLGALRRLAAQSLTLLLSRWEFAALELGQAREQLVRWLMLALAAVILLELAVLGASGALAVALWDRFGPWVLVALALGYAVAGVAVLGRLRREIAEAPPLLSETLAELAKDRDALFGNADARAPRESERPAAPESARQDVHDAKVSS